MPIPSLLAIFCNYFFIFIFKGTFLPLLRQSIIQAPDSGKKPEIGG